MASWHIEKITSRFLAIAVSASAALALLVTVGIAWHQFDTERARQSAAMADIARLNALALQDPMWTLNDRATSAIVGSLAAHSRVACAEVTEPDGALVAATRDRGCATPANAEPMTVPIVYDGHVLGHLTLWLDRDAIASTARSDARLTVLVFLLLSAALVVSAVYALRATVMTPLERLNTAIGKAAKVPYNQYPDDELGRVITAYNGLLDRIEAHNAELEDARTQAVAAAQAKSRFLATMSHEIRTPMHGVLGTVELLRETTLSDEQRQLADIIWHSTESLLGIINDILDLSKIEAGKVRMAPAPANPAEIVQEVTGALGASARGKGLTLELVQAPDLPHWVLADALRLRQVVMNLVGNAVKFTESGGVTITVGRRDDRLEIAVADTGIGIAAADLATLFEPFRQLDTSTTRRHGGTGLGLSISRQLVELMGGEIVADSRPGKGSTFRVLLPLEETAEPSPVATRPPTRQSLAGGRVLAAEDNPVNQWLLRSQLTRLGFETDMHADGRSALAAFATGGGYVAVVTDYHMPFMDGLDLARAIRQTEVPGQRIPIIGMTADAFAETVDECRRAGMDDVVIKPVSLQDLGDRLARGIGNDTIAPCAPQSPPAPGSEAPLVDETIMMAVFGDDPAARGEMAALFGATADDLCARIDAHLRDGDATALSEAAHSLASAALSLGATRLGESARALEHASRRGDWPAIPALAVRVAALDAQTREALAAAPSP
jgi:signal transduction histidine kinase/HPt (histidine-containing phosphotransfer) domain-containing protein